MATANLYIVNNPPADRCAICLDPLNNGETVLAHDYVENGDGALHPLHEQCFKNHLVFFKNCPACQEKINVEELTLPLQKREVAAVFVSNSLIGGIVANTLTGLTNQALQLGVASIPIIAQLAQETFSNEALALGASLAGSLGMGALLTGGIVGVSLGLPSLIKSELEERGLPSTILDEDALSVGLLTGIIVSAVASPFAGALVTAGITGTISVLKPNALHD